MSDTFYESEGVVVYRDYIFSTSNRVNTSMCGNEHLAVTKFSNFKQIGPVTSGVAFNNTLLVIIILVACPQALISIVTYDRFDCWFHILLERFCRHTINNLLGCGHFVSQITAV